jgi:hypothetical protein
VSWCGKGEEMQKKLLALNQGSNLIQTSEGSEMPDFMTEWWYFGLLCLAIPIILIAFIVFLIVVLRYVNKKKSRAKLDEEEDELP